MSRLTRDGTAEPVSRDRILGRERGQGEIHFPFPADLEQDWQSYPVDPYSALCDDHTHIHQYFSCTKLSFQSFIGEEAECWVWRTSRLTRDGTDEPVLRNNFLKTQTGTGRNSFPSCSYHKEDRQSVERDGCTLLHSQHTHTHTLRGFRNKYH